MCQNSRDLILIMENGNNKPTLQGQCEDTDNVCLVLSCTVILTTVSRKE